MVIVSSSIIYSGLYTAHHKGGSFPSKVDLLGEKEVIQCSLLLKIVDLSVRKGGSFEPPEPPSVRA